jgi:hypothetical protein
MERDDALERYLTEEPNDDKSSKVTNASDEAHAKLQRIVQQETRDSVRQAV